MDGGNMPISPQKPGYKGSRVVRLGKDSLDFLGKYSSNYDEAISAIRAELYRNPGTVLNANNSCHFNEERLKTIVKDAVEVALEPFTGA